MRRERLFTQSKESDTKLIITFFQFFAEHEYIIVDFLYWTSCHLWKSNENMEETYEKTQENYLQKK